MAGTKTLDIRLSNFIFLINDINFNYNISINKQKKLNILNSRPLSRLTLSPSHSLTRNILQNTYCHTDRYRININQIKFFFDWFLYSFPSWITNIDRLLLSICSPHIYSPPHIVIDFSIMYFATKIVYYTTMIYKIKVKNSKVSSISK